jgi:hypothetical protein
MVTLPPWGQGVPRIADEPEMAGKKKAYRVPFCGFRMLRGIEVRCVSQQ